jgi:hypothetical protein
LQPFQRVYLRLCGAVQEDALHGEGGGGQLLDGIIMDVPGNLQPLLFALLEQPVLDLDPGLVLLAFSESLVRVFLGRACP